MRPGGTRGLGIGAQAVVGELFLGQARRHAERTLNQDGVAEPAGRYQAHAGPGPLDEGVGRDGRPVTEVNRLFQELSEGEPRIPGGQPDPFQNPVQRFFRRGGGLVGLDPAVSVEKANVRKRPADIDPEQDAVGLIAFRMAPAVILRGRSLLSSGVRPGGHGVRSENQKPIVKASPLFYVDIDVAVISKSRGSIYIPFAGAGPPGRLGRDRLRREDRIAMYSLLDLMPGARNCVRNYAFIQEGEKVLLWTDRTGQIDDLVVEAIALACEEAGAETHLLTSHAGVNRLRAPIAPLVLAAMESADVLITALELENAAIVDNLNFSYFLGRTGKRCVSLICPTPELLASDWARFPGEILWAIFDKTLERARRGKERRVSPDRRQRHGPERGDRLQMGVHRTASAQAVDVLSRRRYGDAPDVSGQRDGGLRAHGRVFGLSEGARSAHGRRPLGDPGRGRGRSRLAGGPDGPV